MQRWSLRVAFASAVLAVAALILVCGDSVDAGGKGKGDGDNKKIDFAIKELVGAEKALLAALAKEGKQKALQQGVIAELNAAVRSTQNALGHARRARNLNDNK